jgi:hypothetical protein
MVVLERCFVDGMKPEADDGHIVQYQGHRVVDQDRVHRHVNLLRNEEVRRQEDVAVVGGATIEDI